MPIASSAAFYECYFNDCGSDNLAPVIGYVNCTDFCLGVAGIADLFFDP